MQPNKPMQTWDDVLSDPRWNAASPEQRESIRQNFFRTRVAPLAPDEGALARGWQKFDARTRADAIPKRGLGDYLNDTQLGTRAGVRSTIAGLQTAEAALLPEEGIAALNPIGAISGNPALRGAMSSMGGLGAALNFIGDRSQVGAKARQQQLLAGATENAVQGSRLRGRRSERVRALEAQDDSYNGMAYLGRLASQPSRWPEMVASTAPQMAATMAAYAVPVVGPALGTGVGASMSAADAASSMRDEILNLPEEQLANNPEWQRSMQWANGDRELAASHFVSRNGKAAMAIAGGTSALVMGLGGRFLNPVERALGGQPSRSIIGEQVRNVLPTGRLGNLGYRAGAAVGGFGREAAGEAIEGASVPFGVNVSMRNAGFERELGQGVLKGAMQEGFVGGLMGAGVGAMQRPPKPQLRAGDDLLNQPPAPSIGDNTLRTPIRNVGANTAAGVARRPAPGTVPESRRIPVTLESELPGFDQYDAPGVRVGSVERPEVTQRARVVPPEPLRLGMEQRGPLALPAPARQLPAPGMLESELDTPNFQLQGEPGLERAGSARTIRGPLRLPAPQRMLPGPASEADFIAGQGDGAVVEPTRPGRGVFVGREGEIRESVNPAGVRTTDTSLQFDDSNTIVEGDITRSNGKPFYVRSDAVAESRNAPGSRVVRVRGGGFVVRRPLPQQSEQQAPDGVAGLLEGPPAEPKPQPRYYRGSGFEAIQTSEGKWVVRTGRGRSKTDWTMRDSFNLPADIRPSAPPRRVMSPRGTGMRIDFGDATTATDIATERKQSENGGQRLLSAIAKAGGLDREAFGAQFGVDPSLFKTRGGKDFVFRRQGGMTPDQLREWLQQNDYMVPDSPDAPPTSDTQDAYDMLDRALRGEDVRGLGELDMDAEFQRMQDRERPDDVEPDFDVSLDSFPAESQRPADTDGADLFPAPTNAERLRAAAGERDAQRNGLNATGRTDMMAGDGELFAGPRPEQMDIEGEIPPRRAREIDDLIGGGANLNFGPNGGASTRASLSDGASRMPLETQQEVDYARRRLDEYVGQQRGGRGSGAEAMEEDLSNPEGEQLADDIARGRVRPMDATTIRPNAIPAFERELAAAGWEKSGRGDSASWRSPRGGSLFLRSQGPDNGTIVQWNLQDASLDQADDLDAGGVDMTDSEEVPFSRGGDRVEGGLSVDALRDALVRRFGRPLRRLLEQGKLVLVESEADLPAGVDVGIGDQVRGVFVDGVSYIVASSVTERTAAGVALHEVGVHDGLASTMGRRGIAELAGRLRRMADSARPAERDLLRDAMELAGNESAGMRDEELVGHAVELADANATGGLGQWLRDVLSRVKAGLYARGFIGADRLTLNDVRMLARGALVKAATPRAADNAQALTDIEASPEDRRKLATRRGEDSNNALREIEREAKRAQNFERLLACLAA